MQSGAPCLVVPETGEGRAALGRIVVAWDGSREAARAMTDGLNYLRCAEAAQVVVVDEANQILCDEASLAQLVNHLVRHWSRRPAGGSIGPIATSARICCAPATTLARTCWSWAPSAMARRLKGRSAAPTRWVLAEFGIPVLLSH